MSAPLCAQGLPTNGSLLNPAQERQMLQGNPALIGEFQQMRQSSDLTPDEICQRLEAKGYLSLLLDQCPAGRADVSGDSTVPGRDRNDKRDWPANGTAFTLTLGSLVAICAIVNK